MHTYIIPTTGAEHIAKKMVGIPGFEVIMPEGNKEGSRRFPDDEIYTRIPRVEELEGRVVVLHSGGPDPNSSYVELDMVLEILQNRVKKEETLDFPDEPSNHHRNLDVFFTYFPYSRQDEVFRAGETNFAYDVTQKLFEYYAVGNIYTIDAHFAGRQWSSRNEFIKNVSAFNELEEAAWHDYHNDILFLAPDAGSQRRTGLKGASKKRIDSYTTEIESDEKLAAVVKGRVVGVVDDMINTGGTMAAFYDKCVGYGAREVIALATHGVIESGIEKIRGKYAKLYLTNTINRPGANVDVTDLVVQTIKRRIC
jgi:hypothetical protein